MQVAGNETERRRLIRGPLDLARTEHSSGIAVEQQPEQRLGCVGLAAPRAVPVIDGRQVELADRIHDKTGQVVRRDTIAQPHARIQGSLVVNGLECSAHALKSTTPWTVQNRLLSDWLLENELRRREKEQEGSREPEACVACLAPRGFISVLKERPQDLSLIHISEPTRLG